MHLALLTLLTVFHVSAPPDTVIVEPNDAVIEVDGTLQFTAKAYDADGAVLEDTRTRWFVRNQEILTIDANGLATAHRPGQVRIIAVVQDLLIAHKPARAGVTRGRVRRAISNETGAEYTVGAPLRSAYYD